jgi:hypothetical protein
VAFRILGFGAYAVQTYGKYSMAELIPIWAKGLMKHQEVELASLQGDPLEDRLELTIRRTSMATTVGASSSRQRLHVRAGSRWSGSGTRRLVGGSAEFGAEPGQVLGNSGADQGGVLADTGRKDEDVEAAERGGKLVAAGCCVPYMQDGALSPARRPFALAPPGAGLEFVGCTHQHL